MPDCPHCHQSVDTQAITCPHCKTPLKAFGHPGIPLYRSKSTEFLCTTCTYHEDDTCNYPQRPFAQECILYHNKAEKIVSPTTHYISGGWPQLVKNWCQRHLVWLALLALIVISVALSL
ncbi:zinc ribbon domain-containing protein [Tychonema sp. BBK16]|uniref:zinc ribbon domain-containing protein n=1 Tax=Tychonema sp. BBK16 TaxID=2699888 RepID=UPI001F2577A9|nr:zinc ribbon domain-containing protein [Tychonema sp. BBK16]MCF6373790.1 zinc ribbon domain-containing protein [Tychonema sp. BBK16]